MEKVESVRDLIDVKIKEFKKENKDKKPRGILMDSFYLASLMEEIGYNEDDIDTKFFEITRYSGLTLSLLEEGNDIIKVI